MPSREDYLRNADECIKLAQASADPQTRTRLLEMAQAWRELADKVDDPRIPKQP
jgi:hypothetical protein